MSKIAYRNFETSKDDFRALRGENDEMIIEGYAALYNVKSRLISERGKVFYEIIEPGAFSEHLQDDVIYTYNHAPDKVMARTLNGTLTLSEDEKGLKFRAILNNTNDSKDLYERISRGDIFENSFGFRESADSSSIRVEQASDGYPVRKILRFERLFDVSSVVRAAYPQTSVYVRELDEEKDDTPEINNKHNSEKFKRLTEVLKLKNFN